MAETVFEINALLNLDTAAYEQAVAEVESSAESMAEMLSEVDEASNDAGDAVSDLGTELAGMSDGASDASEVFADLNQWIGENLELTLDDAERIAELEETMVNAGQGTDEFAAAQNELQAILESAGQKAQNSADGFAALGNGMLDGSASSDTLFTALDMLCPGLGEAASKMWDAALATARFVDEMTQAGDAVDKGSQKMGVSNDAWQRWKYIADLSGTSINTIQMSMRTLTRAVMSNSDAFEVLGLSMEDVQNMSQEELFDAVISALQEMEAGTQRTAIAQQLLGRGAQELAPVLNMTASEMANVNAQYSQFGVGMSDNFIAKSAELQDALTNVNSAWEGFRSRVAEVLVSSLPVAGVINGIAGALGWLNGAMEQLFTYQYSDDPADRLRVLQNEAEQLRLELELGAVSSETYDAQMASLTEQMDECRAAMEGATDATERLDEALEDAGGISEETQIRMMELAQAYEEAYIGALDRVQSYWSLFEEVSEQAIPNLEDMNTAIQSQIEWNTNYYKNLETVANSGVTGVDNLLGSITAMGTDGAAYAQALADAISGGDTEAVQALIDKISELSETQTTLAELQSTFTEEFQAIKSEAETDMAAVQAAIDALEGTEVHNYIYNHFIDVNGTGTGDGDHLAGGIDYVPVNNYPAYLHEGEAVLTKAEAEEWRAGNNGSSVVTNIYAQDLSDAQIDYIVSAVNRKLGGAI